MLRMDKTARQPEYFRLLVKALSLFVFLGFSADAWALQDQLQETRSRLRRTENSVRLLLQSRMSMGKRQVSLQKRLSDGQLNFLLKDYLRASIILLDAVENPQYRGQREWYDAVYYLAESLFKNNNLIGATKYYRLLIKENKYHKKESLVRLMEVSEKTNRYKWLNQFFQQGSSISGELQDKIFYLRGKGLYKQALRSKGISRNQLMVQARQSFSKVGRSSDFWPKARYFVAVVGLQQSNPPKKFVKQAILLLDSALSAMPKADSEKPNKLQDVLLISLGRLHLESQNIQKALEYYQQIGRNSHIFDQSLYEICWAYIRQAQKQGKTKKLKAKRDYKKALRALDLLLAFISKSPLYPRAQLLRSHLFLKLNEFNKAMKNYEHVVKDYSSVYKRMDEILRSRTDLRQTFAVLIGQQLDNFDVRTLVPQKAVKWMAYESIMKRALNMLRDLKLMNKHLNDSRLIIQRLENALNNPNRLSQAPSVKEGQIQAVSNQNELTLLQEKLNKMERSIVYPKMSQSERQEYDGLRNRLANIRALFQRTAKTKKEINKQNSVVTQRVESLLFNLHRVQIQLNYAKLNLTSIRRWINNDPKAQKMTPAQKQSLSQEVASLESIARQLAQEVTQTKQELDLAKLGLGVTPGTQALRIQSQYRQALQQEQSLLKRLKGRVSAQETQWLQEIASTHNRIRESNRQLKRVFQIQNRLITKYATSMKKRVKAEKIKITQYEQQINTLSVEARQVASKIAYQSFVSVRTKFYNLVLKADVGVIDVVWQEKRTTQSKIRKLQKERNDELRVLDNEFRGILKEVKK